MDKVSFDNLPPIEQVELLAMALKATTNPSVVFGDNPRKAKAVYKRLAKRFHPDVVDGDDVAATDAQAALNTLWTKADKQITNSTYGEALPVVDPPAITVDLGGTTYTLGKLLGAGDIGDVYLAHDLDGNEAVVKIVRASSDNDLLENEIAILKALEMSPGFENMRMYFPVVVASGRNADRKMISVMETYEDFIIPSELASLKQLVDSGVFNSEIGLKHIGWIWRKILPAMFFAHRHGIIHACLTPDNIMVSINPERHGIVLVGWVHASENQSVVTSISSDWKNTIYPQEVLDKTMPLPSLDIYMAARSMLYAYPNMPDPLKRYFDWCIQESAIARPDKFDLMLKQFDHAIFNLLNWDKEFVRLNYVPKNGSGHAVEIDWKWWQSA